MELNITETSWLNKILITLPVYLSVTILAEAISPVWLKYAVIDSTVELYESPPMNRVGVSILAFPSGWPYDLLLFPPKDPALLVFFPWDYSMVKLLPKCSLPFNSRAALNDDFLENFTKAVPLDFPSSLVNNFTFVIFPHSLKKSLISLS